MARNPVPALTQDVILQYSGRKQVGLTSFLVDTKKNRVYPVGINEEHEKAAREILDISEYELMRNPQKASRLVTAFIKVGYDPIQKLYYVEEASIGHSSLNMRYGVKHTPQQLLKAKMLFESFIKSGNVQSGKLEIKIITHKRFVMQ